MTGPTRRRDDTGASLVIVMFIITTIALVLGAVLAHADTSVRASLALRDQAASDYNGDGAAQAAINALRKATFNNGTGAQCFGASGTLTLPNYYPATSGLTGGGQASAAVTCTAETGTGAQGTPVPVSSANKPGQAILTLGTSTSEIGFDVGQAAAESDYIRGSVLSDSNINSKGTLSITGPGATIKAKTGCTGTITPACGPTTGLGDPNYPAPTTPPAAPAALVCPTANGGPAVFSPGLYTTAPDAMLTAAKCSKNEGWLYFKPGVYYFDYTTLWTINETAVGGTIDLNDTGGTTLPLSTTTSPAGDMPAPATVPGACVNPINTTAAVGVELAFGGTSKVYMGKSSNAEFCATYQQASIPTALYGLKIDIGSGANIAHAQTGCITQVLGCYALDSDKKAQFYFEGFAYMPVASLNVNVNNVGQPFFNFGIVARHLFVGANPSTKCSQCAFINLPDNSPGYGTSATIVDLNTYVCPAAPTCSAAGKLQLTARVQIYDPTGSPVAGARQITVLSWNEKR
jgi:hypothetical protein